MAENQDWQLGEDEKKALAAEGEEGALAGESAPADYAEGSASSGDKSSMTRILLLVLLLVLVGAAGFYYFAGIPQPAEQEAPAAGQKQPIVMPMPVPPKEDPAAQAAAEPAASAPLPKGVLKEVIVDPQVAAVGSEAPAAEAVAAAAEEATAAAPAPPAQAAQTAAVSAEPPATAAKPEVKRAAESAPPANAAEKPVAAAEKGQFQLQSGVYTDRNKLDEARAALRRMGYDSRVSPVKATLEMTRLRIGVFPPEQGRAKLKEVRAGGVSEAFLLPEKGKVKLYAGSYYDLDKARAYADQLFQKGIRIEEEAATVEVPLSRLSFGDFADRGQADKSAEKVRAAGLEVQVVKKR